jgi:hypothetical protein
LDFRAPLPVVKLDHTGLEIQLQIDALGNDLARCKRINAGKVPDDQLDLWQSHLRRIFGTDTPGEDPRSPDSHRFDERAA